MSSTPYIVLEKLGEGTYATVHKVGVQKLAAVSVRHVGATLGVCVSSRARPGLR